MSFRKIFIKSLSALIIASSFTIPTLAQTTNKATTEASTEVATEKKVLTLQEAVKSALSSSKNLKLLEKKADTNRYILDHTSTDTYSDHDLSYTVQEDEKNKSFYKDKLEYLTGVYYNNLVITNINLELIDKKIASLQKDVDVIKLQLSHGYTDELTLKSKESELEQLKNSKESKEASLAKLKEDFRIITNLDSTKYTLENNITYEPFRANSSINAYITSRIDEMQEFSIEYADYFDSTLGARITTPGTNSISESNYANTVLKKQQLRTDIAKQHDSYMQNLLGQYTQLIEVEKTIDSTKEKIAMLEKNIAATKVKLDKGLATAIEYDKLLLQKEELDNTLLNSIYQHNDLKNVLDKPWVSLM